MSSGVPVILVTGPDSLPGLEREVRRLHRPCGRVTPMRFAPVPNATIRRRILPFAPSATTIVITSSQAVRAFLRRFAQDVRHCEIVVGGPSTLAEVRKLGFPHVTGARPLGAQGIVRLLSDRPPRRIIYPRSERAGPGLSRRLRLQGHTVLDLVAYRVVPCAVSRAERERFSRPFTAVISSPSALAELRRGIGVREFQRFRRLARPLVLGPGTARAVRGHGLRNVRIAAEPERRSPGFSKVADSVLAALRSEP